MGNFAKYMLLAASVLTALIMAGCTDKGPERQLAMKATGPPTASRRSSP